MSHPDPGYCIWQYNHGSWTVIESNCNDGHICGQQNKGQVAHAQFRNMVNDFYRIIGRNVDVMPDGLTLANQSTYRVDCVPVDEPDPIPRPDPT